MARTTARRLTRALWVTIGALVILAIGVYGPATLVGPLPQATAKVEQVADLVPTLGAPTLPQTGASAIVAGSSSIAGSSSTAPDATQDGTATQDSTPQDSTPQTSTPQTSDAAPVSASVLAHAGDEAPVPLGGATKIITALVVLDAKPIQAGKPGPSITVTDADYAGFIAYIAQSARTVSVLPGEVWSERSYLQSMLLGSSNNHADALARWAFGSVDKYIVAANAWLTANGYPGTVVVDATGLAAGSVGTASELALLSAKAFADPVIAEIMAQDTATVPGNRQVENLAAYRADDGIVGLSRSFTDDAGLCFLFQAVVPAGDGTITLSGAFLREPDYDTLDADLTALVESAASNLTKTVIVAKGDSFVKYTTPWGDTASGVALTTESRMLWLTQPVTHEVTAKPVTLESAGAKVGTVIFHTQSGDIPVLLELDSRISDPGPLWRLTHPVPVIGAFLKSRGL
jgi:D-alanyl-D-alanine carboxypeptidase (penicillin-binding protein 5/6)